jgi:hypothetical protein
MFGFFKRKSRQTKFSSPEDYQTEFRRLTQALYDKFAVEDTPYDLLLDAMAAVENEMNRNGGANWNEGNYAEYLDIIRDTLLSERQFAPDQMAKIRSSIQEIAECGRELQEDGESSRPIKEPIDYLVARVVDWCRAHPTHSNENV